jgi:serine/threonine protein kinase
MCLKQKEQFPYCKAKWEHTIGWLQVFVTNQHFLIQILIKIILTEMMNNESYTEKADVWSFGMVLYELTTNSIPYDYCKNSVALSRAVCDLHQIPSIPKDREIHPTLMELMKHCWNWDPQQRPSFTQIVQTLRNVMSQNNKSTK